MTRTPIHSMRRTTAVGLLLGTIVIIGAGVVGAYPHDAVCARWTDIRDKYAAKHHEVPVSSGVVTDKLALQVLASPDGATFTVVLVGADGMGCIIAVGKGWEPGQNAVKGEGRT